MNFYCILPAVIGLAIFFLATDDSAAMKVVSVLAVALNMALIYFDRKARKVSRCKTDLPASEFTESDRLAIRSQVERLGRHRDLIKQFEPACSTGCRPRRVASTDTTKPEPVQALSKRHGASSFFDI